MKRNKHMDYVIYDKCIVADFGQKRTYVRLTKERTGYCIHTMTGEEHHYEFLPVDTYSQEKAIEKVVALVNELVRASKFNEQNSLSE